MKYVVDYSDGQYSVHEFYEGAESHRAVIDLTPEQCTRLEAHFRESQYWQDLLRSADNAFVEQLPPADR